MNLCGDLSYSGLYDNKSVTDSSSVMTYSSLVFSADSDDDDLIDDTKDYSINVEFENYPKATYPTASTDTSSSTITFTSACIADATVTANAMTEPSTVTYTDTEIGTTFVAFDVSPTYCVLEHWCESVTRVDAVAIALPSTVSCADFTLTSDKLSTKIATSRYTDGSFPPGEYIVTIKGATVDSSRVLVAETTVQFTVEDPCDAPVSLT